MKLPTLPKRRVNSSIICFILYCILMLPMRTIAQNGINYEWSLGVGGIHYDITNDVAVDSQGNVYITGYFNGSVDFDPGPNTANLNSTSFGDFFFAKYDAYGNYVYAKSAEATLTGAGVGRGIGLDNSGNIYITGSFSGTTDFDPGPGIAILNSASYNDIFLAKYDNNVNYIYAKSIGGIEEDDAKAVVVDAVGNAYISGVFRGTVDFDPGPGTANLTSATNNADIFFAKYDMDGNYVYAKRLGGTGYDLCGGIAVDIIGNVYVTGHFSWFADLNPGAAVATFSSNGSTDIFFAKYDASGNYVYAKSIGGASGDAGSAITVDTSGNVYITGEFRQTVDFDPGPDTANLICTGNADIFFAKYDSNGNYLFAKNIGGTEGEMSFSIALSVENNIYLTGCFRGTVDFDPDSNTAYLTSTEGDDVYLAEYDNNGNYLNAINFLGASNECASSITTDPNGNIFITGGYFGALDFGPIKDKDFLTNSGSTDIFLAKFNTNKPKTLTWYLDSDNDGWYVDMQEALENPGFGWTSVLPISGYGDCDDNNANMHQTFSFYPDSDGDGHGAYTTVEICAESENSPPDGYLTTNDDCDDNDYFIWLAIPTEIIFTTDSIETCYNVSPFEIEVTPEGGSWSGIGISNEVFSPTQAGLGTHTISYTVHGDEGCRLSASDNVTITVDMCISILENAAEKISVFPTPTSNILNIQGQDIINATLTDMNGRLINNITINDNNAVLNIERYASGFYLLSVTTSTSMQVFKIVKE